MISLKSVGQMCRIGGLLFVVLSAGAAATRARAQTITLLASFNETDGQIPGLGNLIVDARGNLFGTTIYGGADGYGTVFEIPKTSRGYASTPILLASFNGANGAYPWS